MLDDAPETATPPYSPQWALFALAAVTHATLTAFHRIRGYSSPGTAPDTDIPGAARYDRQIVSSWANHLSEYTGETRPFRGKRALELGPGPDLGAGLFLLAEGAATYAAIDVNPLISRASDSFYDHVLSSIEGSHGSSCADNLRQELERFQQNKSDVISYQCRPDLDLRNLGQNTFDLVVSQAAFEHFSDPLRTIAQLSQVIRPGGTFLAWIDLKTHTPVVRDLDPLSIYRLPDCYYRRLSYPGYPNRMRTNEYVEALGVHGWSDIVIVPKQVVDDDYLGRALPHLALPFRRAGNEMSYLSVLVLARRSRQERLGWVPLS